MPSFAKIGKHLGVSHAMAHKLSKQGMPTNTLRAAKLWRDQRAKKREAHNSKAANVQSKRKGRPRNPVKPAKTGDPLNDILANTIAAEEAAHCAYQANPTQAALLSNHTKSAEAVTRIKRMVREEQQHEGILVTKHVMAEKTRRCLEAVMRRLRKLPNESGPQCNQTNPLQAVQILQQAVDEILTAGQEALRDL